MSAARPTWSHVGHALEAIAAGRCNVALITLAGRPRSEGMATGTAPRAGSPAAARDAVRVPVRPGDGEHVRHVRDAPHARVRHHREQLAWIKVAASHHAQHNPHAMLRDVVTVEDVVNSPMIADPLHRLDCCVISDGGGALIVTKPEIAKSLKRPLVKVHRRRRGAEAPGRRRRRSDLFRRRAGPGRRRSTRRASSRPTSSTPRSTTASPSPC